MTDSTGHRVWPDPIGTSSQDLVSVRPGRLLLWTGRACDIDPQHLIDVFGEQRQRFVTVLQGFGPGDWLPRPGALTGPHMTSSAICATQSGSLLAPMTRRSTLPPASTPESRLASG